MEGIAPAIDRRCTFFISPKLLFRRDQHNKTLVLYAFPAVSSRRWLGAKSKFVGCHYAFIGSGEPQQQCLIVRTLRAHADSLNACNQLWNADRLGEKWMSLDLEAHVALAFVTRPSERQAMFCAMSDRIQYI